MRQDELNKQDMAEERDPLFDYFRDNLEDFQLPVNEKCWDNITKGINVQYKKKRFITLLGKVAAALLVIIIPGIIYLSLDHSEKVQYVDNDNHKTKIIEGNNPKNVENNKRPILLDDKPSHNEKYLARTTTTNEAPIKNTSISSNDSIASTENVLKENDKKTDNKTQEDIPSRPKKKETFEFPDSEDKKYLANVLPIKKNKWAFSASVNTGGSHSESSQYTAMSSYPLEYSDLSRYGTPTDTKFSPPFSVGVSIRKQLSNIFSVESGLTYSYLSTKYKDKENVSSPTTLKLHYIGIPVNLVANIYQPNSHFKIYASAGVTGEKGIRANYSQENKYTKESTKKSYNISGLQWSINGSLGASYSLTKNWNVYIEPRVSYYFDNHQPISIRTEKQTIISINSGIRYEY